MIDEADKAKAETLSFLRGLVDGSGVDLADGRRLVPAEHASDEIAEEEKDELLFIHRKRCLLIIIVLLFEIVSQSWNIFQQNKQNKANFRMILLANRPGAPFHGNSLIGEVIFFSFGFGEILNINLNDLYFQKKKSTKSKKTKNKNQNQNQKQN